MKLSKLMLTAAVPALIAGAAFAYEAEDKDGAAYKDEDDAAAAAPMESEEVEIDTADTPLAPNAAGEDADMDVAEGEAAAVPMTEDTDIADGDAAAPTMMGAETEVAEANEPVTLEEMTVADVIGSNVVGAGDEVVGEIDYVINDNESIAAVIGIGGFLGLGEYTVSIPMEEFEMTENQTLVLDMSKEQLEAMPEIDESELESLEGDVKIGDVI